MARGNRARAWCLIVVCAVVGLSAIPAFAHYTVEYLPNNLEDQQIFDAGSDVTCAYHRQHGNYILVGYSKISSVAGFCSDHGTWVTVCQGYVCQDAPYSHGSSYNVWYQSTGPAYYSVVYSHMKHGTPGHDYWRHMNIFP